ncbi:MAG: TRAP transporter large permease [Xanthobacteraceae bacterium]|nr:TRAP transporter large permease [Xanthobacteraceae bacterium]MBX3549897.1 TRAP transporter large permease [Xanthobacteraceae bacterium]MCW5676317.1 TRAP transporter large permease [Xanthobacteraceae bacterium]
MDLYTTIALLGTAVLLLLGVEIVVCLGLGAVFFVLTQKHFAMDNIGIATFSEINLFPLLAMPLYILTGDLIAHSGIAARLIEFSRALIGWARGGMALTLLVACGFFAAISGSNAATVAAMGRMMLGPMERDGYPRDYAAAVAACGGTVGIIIPPSIVFVIYGVASGTSIGDLFVAGIIPGIIMVAAMAIVATITCRRRNIGTTIPFKFSEVARTGLRANLAFGATAVILGGIYGGIFTPTEAAAVAVAYCLIVGLFLTREIKLRDLPRIANTSADVAGLVAPIIALAVALSQILSVLGLPKAGVDALLGLSSEPVVIMLVVLVILLIAGMLMETTPNVILLTPLLAPVGAQLGYDPIHFGVIFVVTLAIGFVTPPLGLNLFVASSIARVPVMTIAWRSVWMIVGLLVAMLLVTFVPWFSLAFLTRAS